nr:hypothetical protein [Tanacetum cinerariifolium]
MQEVILFYNGLEVLTRQIIDSKGAIPTKTAADEKVAIQEMAEYSQNWHNIISQARSTETSDGLAAIQAQLTNLEREIKKVNEKVYAAQVGCEQCKGTHYTKDCPLKEEDHPNTPYRRNRTKGSYGPKFLDAYSYGAIRIDDSLPRKEKDPGSFTLPCYVNNVFFENALGDLGASVSVMPLLTYLNLGLGELAHTTLTVKLADETMKHPKRIAKNVLVGIGKFVFLIDFIILDMPEDVKVPLILERLFLSTAYAKIDVLKRKITLRVGDEKIIFKSVKPASSLIKRVYRLSLRELIELDLEARLMGETLVLNRPLDPLYGDYVKLNDLNVPLEHKRDQVDDLISTIEKVVEDMDPYPEEGIGEVVVEEPFCKVSFVEDMDPYPDEGIGEVVVEEPFCKASCVETKRFDGIITIHNEGDSVTYQMMRANLRFKHHTNEQCNKIPPLLNLENTENSLGKLKTTLLADLIFEGINLTLELESAFSKAILTFF